MEAARSEILIEADTATLPGDLVLPQEPAGLIVFAHGSGSSRMSPRNKAVAAALVGAGFGTLLFDLLTGEEDLVDRRTAELRFDIPLLGARLSTAVHQLCARDDVGDLPIGCFGASTGAAAALIAAAGSPELVRSVVARGGRPDLAGPVLADVRAPTLLIVGGRDVQVIEMNREAAAHMRCPVDLRIVAGATHLFEEPGALEDVAALAAEWFHATLPPPTPDLPESGAISP